MKTCNKCKIKQALSEFCKNKISKDNLNYCCKSCGKLAAAKWNKENPVRYLTNLVKWRKNNIQRIRRTYAIYQKENCAKVNYISNLYQKRHPAKVNALKAKRRAAKLQRIPKWLTLHDLSLIEMLYQRAKYLTDVTGVPHTVDHIIPLQGKNISGLHVVQNLRIITAHENFSKGNKFI